MPQLCPIHKRPLICLACIGQKGGNIRSRRKAIANRAKGKFGKLGGRPRQYPRCQRYSAHRFSPATGRCPCGYSRP